MPSSFKASIARVRPVALANFPSSRPHLNTHSMRSGNPPAEASVASNETDDLSPELDSGDICLLNRPPEVMFNKRSISLKIKILETREDNDELLAMNMYGFDYGWQSTDSRELPQLEYNTIYTVKYTKKKIV